MSAADKERQRFRTAFGDALEGQMRQRGINQSTLAQQLGVTPAFVNHTLTGRKYVSPEYVERAASALDLPETSATDLHRAAATTAGYRIAPEPEPKKKRGKAKKRG